MSDLDYEKIINNFLDLKSIKDETRKELIEFPKKWPYIAPEIFKYRFFNGNEGLCNILTKYESENQEVRELYQKILLEFSQQFQK